jgi:glycerophosphoryl diester phosphodiesterase
MPPIVIAHRTCPLDAAENSLEGIRVAARLGAEAVEVDVRLTSDGYPVLLHDNWLWRTTWKFRRLNRTPLESVNRVRLRDGDETIPGLADALAALADDQRIAIDVKDPTAAEAVIGEVRKQGLEDRALFWVKSTDAVTHAAEVAPEVEASLLRDARRPSERTRFLEDARRVGARGISAHWSVIKPDFVAEARACGLLVYSWCKKERPEPAKLKLVDGLVTDWPGQAREAITNLS